MPFRKVARDWKLLDPEADALFRDSRLQLHWAAQAVAAVGEALVAPESDFSHTSMEWMDQHGGLAGQAIPGGARVLLQLESCTMRVLGAGGATEPSFPLTGRTLAESVSWLSEALGRHGEPVALELPSYEMPEHGFGTGLKFGASPERAAALGRWYANAAALQRAVHENTLGASPVRCWPHHFDIATLITLEPGAADPEEARSIGFGMSPGDASHDEPYFYVNPWPPAALKDEELPPLRGNGIWHREGWTGAVLPASRLDNASAIGQAHQVLEFVQSAIAADRILLGTL